MTPVDPPQQEHLTPRERRAQQRREQAMRTVDPSLPTLRVNAGHRVFLHEQGEAIFGPGTFDLLVLVNETGSLHKAASTMGMSYNKAWLTMRRAEERLHVKLLARRTGGHKGGGSVLTPDGALLVERFRAFLDEADADLAHLYHKHFGDLAFAQPNEAPRGAGQPADDGRGAPAQDTAPASATNA